MTTTSPPSVTSRRSLDTTIVRVVTAVIGLHVVDDNFLQPNAGTSAADHLLGWSRAPRAARRRGGRVPASSAVLPAA